MRKIICILLFAVLLTGTLTACGKSTSADQTSQTPEVTGSENGEESSEEATDQEAVMDYSEHETFTVWLYATQDDFASSYSQNPIVNYLNNKYNVTIDFQQPVSGTESDALSLMFGTGEYTDMIEMSMYSGSIAELYEDGVIVDIAEYLDYMPNLKKLLESDVNLRRSFYNDEGKILSLKNSATEVEYSWGGLVYRHDILDTMTGGNVAFPSGNESPTTIEDWDYMLPLFKQYFEAAGMTEYAPLIIPASGMFGQSELLNGFGASVGYFVEDGEVKYGPLEDGFYNYLEKMKEWFEAGYIYKDFASRTNDPYYFPNSSLTYGGAAGIWFGLQSQLGDVMSMPEYELYFDVRPLACPIDTDNGITEAAPLSRPYYYDDGTKGWVITSTCQNIPKLLSVLDHGYSEEGSIMKTLGLTKEQGADTDPIYVEAGMTEGTYWYEGDKLVYNPLHSNGGGALDIVSFVDARLPGLFNRTLDKELLDDKIKEADSYWGAYKDASRTRMPGAMLLPGRGR